MKRRSTLAAASGLLALCAAAAGATTVERWPLDRTCEVAENIAHVRVLEATPEVGDGGYVWTTYRLEVLEALKGQPGPELEIVQVGGVVGERGTLAPGIPHFVQGEEAVVFTADFGGGRQSIVNTSQGALRVQAGEGRSVRREVALLHPELAGRDLAQLKDLIRAIVAADGEE